MGQESCHCGPQRRPEMGETIPAVCEAAHLLTERAGFRRPQRQLRTESGRPLSRSLDGSERVGSAGRKGAYRQDGSGQPTFSVRSEKARSRMESGRPGEGRGIMKRTDVTYGQLDRVLRSLGFSCRTVTGEPPARVYEHKKSGARIMLPPFPEEDQVLDDRLLAARTTLDLFGIADPKAFAARLQNAGYGIVQEQHRGREGEAQHTCVQAHRPSRLRGRLGRSLALPTPGSHSWTRAKPDQERPLPCQQARRRGRSGEVCQVALARFRSRFPGLRDTPDSCHHFPFNLLCPGPL
jgi:hypothetical protein